MTPPDPWVTRHIDLAPAGLPVLDVAAGTGRHSRLALEMGHRVVAVDIDVSPLSVLAGRAGLEILQADLEDASWPFEPGAFGCVIVCNYLWRPLFSDIGRALAPGGVLIWTTFAAGNERFGRPRNPDFLLKSNELIGVFQKEFEVVAFRHGPVDRPGPAMRQSIVVRRPDMDRSGDG